MKRLFLGLLLLSSCTTTQTQAPPPESKSQRPPLTIVDGCPTGDMTDRLIIHHFNVGQGDSTFFRTPNGTTVLVDAGVPKKGAEVVLPKLQSCYKLESIDYVVMTHFDQDHHGGMPAVLSALKVKKALLDSGDDSTGGKIDQPGVRKYLASANATSMRREPKLSADEIKTGDAVTFDIVAAEGRVRGSSAMHGSKTETNSLSIAMKVSFGNFGYFVGGDLTKEVEVPVAELVGDLDVLKANHHGSETSNSKSFIDLVRPEQVIVSAGNGGVNKRYNHPSASVLRTLHESTSVHNIYQTEKGESLAPPSDILKVKVANGDVIVVAEEDRYWVNGDEFTVDERARLPFTNDDLRSPAAKKKNVERLSPSSATYSCSKKTCKQISSCEEAMFLLNSCGLTRLDGDGDGVPCERLCR